MSPQHPGIERQHGIGRSSRPGMDEPPGGLASWRVAHNPLHHRIGVRHKARAQQHPGRSLVQVHVIRGQRHRLVGRIPCSTQRRQLTVDLGELQPALGTVGVGTHRQLGHRAGRRRQPPGPPHPGQAQQSPDVARIRLASGQQQPIGNVLFIGIQGHLREPHLLRNPRRPPPGLLPRRLGLRPLPRRRQCARENSPRHERLGVFADQLEGRLGHGQRVAPGQPVLQRLSPSLGGMHERSRARGSRCNRGVPAWNLPGGARARYTGRR